MRWGCNLSRAGRKLYWVEMYQIVLAGHPRPVRHLESTLIATGVAGRPRGEEGAPDRDTEQAVGPTP